MRFISEDNTLLLMVVAPPRSRMLSAPGLDILLWGVGRRHPPPPSPLPNLARTRGFIQHLDRTKNKSTSYNTHKRTVVQLEIVCTPVNDVILTVVLTTYFCLVLGTP